MKNFKLKYVKGFLNRTELRISELLAKIEETQNNNNTRSWYAEPININGDDFFDVILLDACFIVELFVRKYEDINFQIKDPLELEPWMMLQIRHDLIRLENQLPFSTLEHLYRTVKDSASQRSLPSFVDICFNYLNRPTFRCVNPNKNPEHFTDLLKSSILSSSLPEHGLGEEGAGNEVIHVYSVSQLMKAGLKFTASPNDCLLDLKLSNGVLSMPVLNVNASTDLYFRNMVAYEHCHDLATKIITQYLVILKFLIITENDVNILVDKKIIVNWVGDANNVVTIISNLSSGVSMPNFCRHYFTICSGLNNFYENPRNKLKALIKHEYFSNPVKKASSIVALVLLLFTSIQTACSFISVFIRGKISLYINT
ncbi:hypothetical protein V8G54_011178 [Vigna mungo]|uniref:Uncharacterized protein n=1 Tax=Vigna mungo TaxID=3915 RepID=A0AAQ3NRU6_VIGMU